jgi:hypothetical protein
VLLPATSIIGSFTDANTSAPAGDFTATIDWGDGSPNGVGSVVACTTAGSFNVEATHIYAKPGTYKPSIVVHDVGGSTVTLAGTPAVINQFRPRAPYPSPRPARPPLHRQPDATTMIVRAAHASSVANRERPFGTNRSG